MNKPQIIYDRNKKSLKIKDLLTKKIKILKRNFMELIQEIMAS